MGASFRLSGKSSSGCESTRLSPQHLKMKERRTVIRKLVPFLADVPHPCANDGSGVPLGYNQDAMAVELSEGIRRAVRQR